jgi:hypothetical protein
MVLRQETHYILRKVSHVFAYKETNMATINYLVMNDSIADLIFGPLGVDGVSNLIILACKDCNRNVFNFV